MVERLERRLYLAVHDDYPAQPALDITDRLTELTAIGSDLEHVDVPFMIYTDGCGCVELRDVAWTR